MRVPKLRLLLVDDHALFRDGLFSLLSYQNDMSVVGQTATGEEALRLAEAVQPDVVLMDIDLPGIDGVEATRRLKERLPDVCVIMLTVYDEEDRLFDSIRAGAQGYLVKSIRSNELLERLRGLARGEAAISRRMAARILREFALLEQSEPSQEPMANLTNREIEVLELVAGRLSNKEIGERLSISENTVKNHLKSILAKLHVESRREAAAFALSQGWVRREPARIPQVD